jgi:hypothetical protein
VVAVARILTWSGVVRVNVFEAFEEIEEGGNAFTGELLLDGPGSVLTSAWW